MTKDNRLTGAPAHTRVADVSVFKDMAPDRPHQLSVLAGADLEALRGPDGRLRPIVLSDRPSVIGRSEQADIQIDADSLSRQHAVLSRTRNGFKIKDLGSRNGVHVNEVRVHSAILRDGDTVRLGELIMRYYRGF